VVAALLLCAAPAWAQEQKETDCKNKIDDDNDAVLDCADSDCFKDEACKSAGGLENNNALCSDWVDNDRDDATDCDDVDCAREGVTVCKGSWEGTGQTGGQRETGGGNEDPGEIPQLGEGMSVEDLIGKGSDKDGERNEFVCSDGIDNDLDGKTDCADFGCRFDPEVTVCRGTPGLRFSVGAHIAGTYTAQYEGIPNPDGGDTPHPDEGFENGEFDMVFNRLQIRAFGPIPFLQDSFFLISGRFERTPRLTFAFFSMPLGRGHYVNLNSGGGGLSNSQVLSVSKHILLDPPFYLFNAFEQGNGAAVEFYGPIVNGLLDYRTFFAGGSGQFNGNIGGRFFNTDDPNFTWGVGFQLALYALGRFDRWDTRFLYTEVPAALTFYLGARYDQRAFERFPAANLNILYRHWRFVVAAESYLKRELEFQTWQFSYNVQVGFLVVPKWLMIAGDVGTFRLLNDFVDPPEPLPTDLRRIVDEFQWRAAVHLFVWRNTGILTLLYTDDTVEAANEGEENAHTGELRLEIQFRF
jgi:hypothetical protein